MNAPMLFPFLSLGCGIILAFMGVGLWGGVSIVVLGSFIYYYLTYVGRNPVKAFRYYNYHYFWLFLFFLGIGIIGGNLSLPYQPQTKEIKESVIAEGKVTDIRNRTSGDQLTIEIQSLYDKRGFRKDYSNFKIDCYSDAVSVTEGDIIVFPANSLRKIEDSPNSFRNGYAEVKAKQGIYYNIRVTGGNISKIGHDRFYVEGISKGIRDDIIAFIEKQSLQRSTRDFIITILSGDRAYLNPDMRQTFADAGIAHVLALSGMHIAIIAGIFLSILFPLNFFGKYKLRYLLTALLLWFYAFVTGMSPSIIRACVMASAFIIALILERKNTAFNSLCLAGFIILLFNPMALYEISFQLSFLCVSSLILFAEKFNPFDHRHHPKLYNISALILASLITTFTSWIVVAYYFQTFPTLFLPANTLILPFLPFYVTGIIIYLILELCGFHIELFTKVIDYCFNLIVSITSFFGEGTVLNLSVPFISVFLWLVGVFLLAISVWKLNLLIVKRIWIYSLSALLLLSSIVVTVFYEPIMERGFIICNSYPALQINVSDGKNESLINVPSNALSLHQINRYNIIVLDYDSIPEKDHNPLFEINKYINGINNSDLLKKNINKNTSNIDYLIITGRYKGNISRIKEVFNPKQIIIHSSIRKQRENILIEEASKLNIPVHSLRRDNALKVSLY